MIVGQRCSKHLVPIASAEIGQQQAIAHVHAELCVRIDDGTRVEVLKLCERSRHLRVKQRGLMVEIIDEVGRCSYWDYG